MTRFPTVRADTVARLVLASSLVVSGCGSGPTAPVTDPIYYVSIGDSYATGDGPYGAKGHDGFAYLTENALQRKDDAAWRLVNFGCSGATAQQMVHQPGCDIGAGADGGSEYPDMPQVDAAVQFIAEHRDQVGLVTIVAGGNDIAACLAETALDRALTCAETATESLAAALDEMLDRVGGVLDNGVPMVGVSYLNVFIADENADIAAAVFDERFNPALRQTYSRSGALFADAPTGSVDDVCALSHYCNAGDPHPNRAGHQLIADEVLKTTALG